MLINMLNKNIHNSGLADPVAASKRLGRSASPLLQSASAMDERIKPES